MFSLPNGVYPTMITPFDAQGQVDYDAAENLVRWYARHGCQGVFAVCQSSELLWLSLAERINLVRCVRAQIDTIAEATGRKMALVASGHTADDIREQARELTAMADAGADCVVLITNRLDTPHTSDAAWAEDMRRLLALLDPDVPLGLYECPTPYKRLLTEKMIESCTQTGRFFFLKDTCCDAARIARRIAQIGGTDMRLFNANAQTLLSSLRSGGAGYSGIMANFHPSLYVRLTGCFSQEPERAEDIGALLSLLSFTEVQAYPATAKYHLGHLEGVTMTTRTRVLPPDALTPYDTMVVEQMKRIADKAEAMLGLS